MAKCKYILKLPGGESLQLPASFNALEYSSKINKAFSDYIDESDEEKKIKKFKELAFLISSNLNITQKPQIEAIKDIITISETEDNLYNNINKWVNVLGTYNNVGDAIMNYMRSGDYEKNMSKLQKFLGQERTGEYFKNLGLKGLLGISNLREQKNVILNKHQINLETGTGTSTLKNLLKFINILEKKESLDSNTLYGTQDIIIGSAWADENTIMYEMNNDLSLFLGLFKSKASKLTINDIKPYLENLNKALLKLKQQPIDISNFNINQFFVGTITNNKINVSTFEDLINLGLNEDIRKSIDSIIGVVAKSISDEPTLPSIIKSLFWQLSPNSYGKDRLTIEEATQQFDEIERIIDEEYKLSFVPFHEMVGDEKDKYFSAPESIPSIGNSTDVIRINKDLVLFPTNGITIYGLVKGIYKREDGVAIYGQYRNQFGVIEQLNHVFKPNELIKYKYREAPIDPREEGEVVLPIDGLKIYSKVDLNQKLIKQLLRKGDTVGNKVVIGVYPGFVEVVDANKKASKIYYSKIKSITSAKAALDLYSDNKIEEGSYVSIEGSDLSEGDYFYYEDGDIKLWKRILYTNDEEVFSLVKGLSGQIVLATNKNGLKGLRNVFGELNSNDIETIDFEYSNINSSKSKKSSFVDKKLAEEDDLFFYMDGDVKKYGKVLNNNKVLTFNRSLTSRLVLSLNDIKNPTFFTNRDISTKYAMFNVRANHMKISIKEESDSALDEEVEYVVPPGTDVESLILLTDGYFNVGSYKDKAHITKDDIIITDRILKSLGKPENSKVFFTKESSESSKYEKNLDSLMQINYFNKLSKETKHKLDVLQPGTYFSLYFKSYIGYDIYRIVSVDGDLVKVHRNRTNELGTITTEMIFTKEQLLDSNATDYQPENSIARLYMQHGNSKIRTILDETAAISNEIKNSTKSINDLINKMSAYVEGFDIEIKMVPSRGNFESNTTNQKAKLAVDENGKVSILINSSLGKQEDVIHEFLHLFLTPLRYKSPEIYNSLIKSVVKDNTLNVTDAEEEFVKYVSELMVKDEDYVESFSDYNLFVKTLQDIVNDVNPRMKTEDMKLAELLNTKLYSLFDINPNDNSHAMFNESMIVVEPMMREWMKNNDIILNCE